MKGDIDVHSYRGPGTEYRLHLIYCQHVSVQSPTHWVGSQGIVHENKGMEPQERVLLLVSVSRCDQSIDMVTAK